VRPAAAEEASEEEEGQPPQLTGPVADTVNMIVAALNNQDATYLQKEVPADAIWLDEHGHALPAGIWINRLMQAKPVKKITLTNLTGQATTGVGRFQVLPRRNNPGRCSEPDERHEQHGLQKGR
jgi:hypothetical protein